MKTFIFEAKHLRKYHHLTDDNASVLTKTDRRDILSRVLVALCEFKKR